MLPYILTLFECAYKYLCCLCCLCDN